MELRDRDLISIQEARELAAQAVIAQQKFAQFSQEKIDAIVEAVAKAAAAQARNALHAQLWKKPATEMCPTKF